VIPEPTEQRAALAQLQDRVAIRGDNHHRLIVSMFNGRH
jgi:hypothetical protein